MSGTGRRFYRTLLTGLAALGVLIWAAVERFGIAWRDIAELLLGTVVVVAGIIVLAALCALVWTGLRRWLRRG
ncbi:MAG: hypothetical protein R3E50_04400 [Halioglobus sp.]